MKLRVPKVNGGAIRAGLEMVASVLVICVSLTMLWRFTVVPEASPAPLTARTERRNEPPLPTRPVSLRGAILKGTQEAAVGILVFSDFQCPFCARFAQETLAELDTRFIATGKVLFAFRHLPLEAIHRDALRASQAAECAERYGKFWQMHDAIFADQKALDVQSLVSLGQKLGIAPTPLHDCINGGVTQKIRDDMALAKSLGVTGTPTFFVGELKGEMLTVKQRLVGTQPVAQFAAAIEKLDQQ